jgi:hypothetical protein
MAEQWTQHFLSLIADLRFSETLMILCSIRYYQGRHLGTVSMTTAIILQ